MGALTAPQEAEGTGSVREALSVPQPHRPGPHSPRPQLLCPPYRKELTSEPRGRCCQPCQTQGALYLGGEPSLLLQGTKDRPVMGGRGQV